MTQTISTNTPLIGAEQVALLERLCNASAVSGDEREVRSIVLELVRPLADEVRVDALGSILAVRHARTENPLRVMLDAHMDEVGLMIVADDDGGLYRFVKVGGVDDRSLPGKIVLVGRDNVPGVIGAKPIHLTEPGETDNKIPLDALRIDVGLGGGKVKVGDRATFATRFKDVGPSFISKALDDRLGCASLILILQAAAQGDLDHLELLFSWSVQEELGLRGARVTAQAFNPDLAIALDATGAYDLPMVDEGEDGALENAVYNARLGFGPAIYLADASTLSDPRLARLLMQTADALNIPYQIRQPGPGSTNAGAINKALAGVPTISVSVPGRYMHTAASVCRRADWENALKLVWNSLARLDRSLLDGERA